MRKHIALLLLGVVCCQCLVGQTATPPPTMPIVPPVNDTPMKKTLKKSLLFPGLGQLAEKQYVKGILFMVGEITCITIAVLQNSQANDSYGKYVQADNAADAIAWRAETEAHDRNRNAWLLAGIGIWITNMVDAYITCKKKYAKPVQVQIQGSINHASPTIALSLRYNF